MMVQTDPEKWWADHIDWVNSQEYLDLWETLPCRWMLPVPELGEDPASVWYHDQPVPLQDLLQPGWKNLSAHTRVLLERCYGTRTVDQVPGFPLADFEGLDENYHWWWTDPQTSPLALADLVRDVFTVLPHHMVPKLMFKALAADWEYPLLVEAIKPFGQHYRPEMNDFDRSLYHLRQTPNQVIEVLTGNPTWPEPLPPGPQD
jgi:hypothetical protein